VLSLEAAVPQIALGHDTRLKGLYQELVIQEYLVDSFSTDLWISLEQKVDDLISNPDKQDEILKKGFKEHLSRTSMNPELLKTFLKETGLAGKYDL
jgi:polysaccharide pyruvyl transferase WcaK-like protein